MNALATGLARAGRYLKAVMGDNAYEGRDRKTV